MPVRKDVVAVFAAQESEPVYMRKHLLRPAERRLLTVIWALGFVAWLAGGAMWIWTATVLPWVVVSVLGSITAVVFGMAVRYRYHLFPWWWNEDERQDGGKHAA